MFKSKKPGITIVETLLVLAISSALFVVVIGVFNTRKKTQVDDAARQVMDEISKVRNQAQQGQGPSSSTESAALAGNELFGQAIEFTDNKMVVHKLMQNAGKDKSVSEYGSYEIQMPNQLQWNIYSTSQCGGGNFTSCQKLNINSVINPNWTALPGDLTEGNMFLVFRNGSGASYALSKNIGSAQYSYAIFKNYAANNQPYLQLAFGTIGVSGSGGSRQLNMEAATNRYFALFDLSIPNNQDLQVVK
jgi:type II secretory pathway pseudopilin PulG